MNNRLKQQEMEREREMMERQLFLKECDKQMKLEMAAQRQQLEEFQKRMKAKKERGYINGKEGGGSTSIPSTSDTVQGNREEAFFISSVLQKLYSLSQHVELCERAVPAGDIKNIIGIINELSMILNFLRGKTSGELKYLICKVMEMAMYLDNIMETDDIHLSEPNSLRCRLRKIKMQMIKSGADGEEKVALILSVMQKLERHHVVVDDVKGVIDELRMILDFLREKKGEDLSRLDYLICEAIEMALYLDLNVGVFDLWKEITSVKSRLQGIKLRMLRSGVDGEDPEALVLLVIQKLDAQHVELAKFVGGSEDIKGVIDELRMILDLLREEKTVHKYLICDLIEIALYLNEIEDTDNSDVSESVQSRLREIRLCMLKSETETETETRSEDVEDMVGLHEQVRLVLGRAIFNEVEGLQISVITGIVGVGKTSLARQVYNHPTVVDQFERRAWVRVSSDLTHKEILMKIIQQVVVDSSLILEEMDNRSLKLLLHQHLQGMPYLIVLDGLQMMTSLDRLGIEEVDANSDVRKLFASLAELDALKHLVLRGFRFKSMPCLDELHVLHSLTTLRLEGLLAKLPSVNNFPPNLTYLRLVNTCLDEDPMPVLEKLPCLTRLKLKNAYTGQGMVISDKWPGDLEVLCIEEFWNLKNVHFEKGALKWLEKLEIKNCPLLETLPEEIGSMELQELNMTTTKNIAAKIRKSGATSKIRVVHINP